MKKGDENGKEKDKKRNENRDSRGRFTRGAEPGPGRGRKKGEVDLIAQATATVIKALRSDDEKVRLKAAGLLQKFQASTPENPPDIVDPEVMQIIEAASETCAYKAVFNEVVEMAEKKPVTLDELKSVISRHEDPFQSFDDDES